MDTFELELHCDGLMQRDEEESYDDEAQSKETIPDRFRLSQATSPISKQPALDPKAFVQQSGTSADTVYFNLEIMELMDMDPSTLYIEFTMEYPESWRPLEGTHPVLSGCTQRSESKFSLKDGRLQAYFGFPLDLEFQRDVFPDTSTQDLQTLVLFMHIKSCDRWQRHTSQGYAFIRLGHEPGFMETEVPVWRPRTRHPDALRSFFIGHSSELEDPVWWHLRDAKDKLVNKFGGRIETVGSVKVKMQCMELRRQQGNGQVKRYWNSDGNIFMADIEGALERARMRLLQLKQE
jgi:hypothetical protein